MMLPEFTTILISSYSYHAIVLATIVAQPAAALACGALVSLGVLGFGTVFALIFVTDMIMDCVWYILGWHHGERTTQFMNRVFRVDPEKIKRIHGLFHTKPGLMLISSKLLGGLGIMPVVLFTAGSARMPFIKYITLNALGEIFWTGGLLLLGFFFSSAIGSIGNTIQKIFLTVLFALILAILFYVLQLFARRLLR
jgi:membrane protein DedA with SNARE-associated domain